MLKSKLIYSICFIGMLASLHGDNYPSELVPLYSDQTGNSAPPPTWTTPVTDDLYAPLAPYGTIPYQAAEYPLFEDPLSTPSASATYFGTAPTMKPPEEVPYNYLWQGSESSAYRTTIPDPAVAARPPHTFRD